MQYQTSPRTLKCEICEEAERLYQKPIPDCSKCPAAEIELLPENQIAWKIYCRVHDQTIGPKQGLNYMAVKFMFDLYIPESTPEEQREVFEKLLLIHRNWK